VNLPHQLPDPQDLIGWHEAALDRRRMHTVRRLPEVSAGIQGNQLLGTARRAGAAPEEIAPLVPVRARSQHGIPPEGAGKAYMRRGKLGLERGQSLIDGQGVAHARRLPTTQP
jgi:hypothetical protein